MWSMGCVIGEMIVGRAFFSGNNNMDQMIKIIKVLGTPTEEDFIGMKVDPKQHDLIQIAGSGIGKKVKGLFMNCPDLLIDLLEKILVYNPSKRYSARQALEHPIFKGD